MRTRSTRIGCALNAHPRYSADMPLVKAPFECNMGNIARGAGSRGSLAIGFDSSSRTVLAALIRVGVLWPFSSRLSSAVLAFNCRIALAASIRVVAAQPWHNAGSLNSSSALWPPRPSAVLAFFSVQLAPI